MIRKKRYLAAKMGLLALGIAMLLPGQKVDAAAKKTIYNSPYVTFSPDGKAWTTCAGGRDYTWYDADTLVSTGITSSLRALNTGEHYYKVSRYGEIPIGYWQVSHRPAQCIHNGYPKDNHLYHGIQYGRHKCFRNYNSGWMAYCAACVFFMKKSLGDLVQRALAGFAAGVMVAASIWSLLIPAIEQSEGMGKLSFLPAFIGFWVGVLFLLLLDRLIPHLHVGSNQAEGPKSRLGRTTMMVLAVTLHNIPEGMAVGVMYAGFLAGNAQITAASALVLSLGIAIQNFPEGAIISMPLRAEGESKGKAFLGGVLSGVVEPIGAVLTILAAQLVIPALPYFLSFAAGAMLYVVVEELIPEMSQGKHSNIGTVFFAAGFSVMLTLDVALG